MLDSQGDHGDVNAASGNTLSLGKQLKDRHIWLASLFKYHKPKKVTFKNETIAVNATLK